MSIFYHQKFPFLKRQLSLFAYFNIFILKAGLLWVKNEPVVAQKCAFDWVKNELRLAQKCATTNNNTIIENYI